MIDNSTKRCYCILARLLGGRSMAIKTSDRETGAERQYYRVVGEQIRLSRRSFLLSSATLAVSTMSSLPFPKVSLADTVAPARRLRVALPIGGGSSLTITQSEDTVLSEPSGQSLSFLEQKASGLSGINNPRIRVLRADDQLDLVFDLENLRVEYVDDASVALFRRIVSDDPGRITVYLPGQHVFEPSFFVSANGGDPLLLPPLQVRLGEPARLVFEYQGDGPLPFSIDTLLDWRRFKPKVPKSPVSPSAFRKPLTSETAIEAPYGIYLAPRDDHFWNQASKEVGKSGFREVWHASMVGRPNASLRSGFENADVVAVWSREPEPSLGQSPIDTKSRKDIVKLTHGADGNATPVTAHALMLTGHGAFLNLRADFPYDCYRPISLTHVSQRSAYGQDNDVVISRRGFLYPFGHEVEVVWATAREPVQVFPMVGSIPVEGDYLRKRLFIQFKQQERSYVDMGNAATLPFRSIRFEDDLSPPLDEPVSAPVSITKTDGTPWLDKAFWPSVSSEPVMFSAVAEDWAGKLVRLSVPVIFIEFDAASTDEAPVAENNDYLVRLRDVQTRHKESGRGISGIYDSSVAVSAPKTVLDTSVELLKVQFDAAIEPRSICPTINSLFYLTVPQIQARLPMLRTSVSESENIGWFSVQDPDANEMETFLQAAPGLVAGDEKRIRLGCSGQTEKSGGFFSLDMTVGGVSRLYGATGQQNTTTTSLALAGPQTFNPLDYFGDDTVLFGGIKIKDVLQAGLSVAEAQMPKVIQRIRAYPDVPSEIRQSIDWTTEQFQSWPEPSNPIFAVQQSSPDLVVDRASPTRFTLSAQTSVSTDTSIRPKATVSARLSNFSLQLLFGKDGVLIRFRSFAFMIDTAGTTSFRPEIDSVELKGDSMAFIQALQELLKDILGDIGISINLLPSGAEIQLPSFNFPSLSFGAFLLQNLSIASSVEISFRSQPTLYKFNFSTPENPFTVAVGIYGGAGSFALAIDTREILSFSASFGFGAFARLDLGIASGSAAVLGGLSYWLQKTDVGGVSTTQIAYLFYVRAYGSVTALGFITVGVDFYLGLTIRKGTPSFSEGLVEVSYSVRVGFFKKSFKLTFRRRFNGSGTGSAFLASSGPSGRTRRETLTKSQWTQYRRAFARRN